MPSLLIQVKKASWTSKFLYEQLATAVVLVKRATRLMQEAAATEKGDTAKAGTERLRTRNGEGPQEEACNVAGEVVSQLAVAVEAGVDAIQILRT